MASCLSDRLSACLPAKGRRDNSIGATRVITSWPTATDGCHVRELGCRKFGPGAVRVHDGVSHRIPGLLDRACKLPRGAGSALALDRTRGLHQPVQLLA